MGTFLKFLDIGLNNWIIIIAVSLFFGLIYGLLIWYMEKHPMTGKVMGKITKEEKHGKQTITSYQIVLKNMKNQTAKVIVNKDTWDRLNFGDDYTMASGDHYSMDET